MSDFRMEAGIQEAAHTHLIEKRLAVLEETVKQLSQKIADLENPVSAVG